MLLFSCNSTCAYQIISILIWLVIAFCRNPSELYKSRPHAIELNTTALVKARHKTFHFVYHAFLLFFTLSPSFERLNPCDFHNRTHFLLHKLSLNCLHYPFLQLSSQMHNWLKYYYCWKLSLPMAVKFHF